MIDRLDSRLRVWRTTCSVSTTTKPRKGFVRLDNMEWLLERLFPIATGYETPGAVTELVSPETFGPLLRSMSRLAVEAALRMGLAAQRLWIVRSLYNNANDRLLPSGRKEGEHN